MKNQFHINIRFNPKYDKQPGQSIDGVTFRNITYNGVGENPSLIKGLDKERMVRNITFENVVVNGEKIKDLKGFITNEYIEGIKIKQIKNCFIVGPIYEKREKH